MIEVRDVSVVTEVATLLEPLSLDAQSGQALAVRGSNGSGKTTLLRLIAGQLEPTTGTVTVGQAAADDNNPAFRKTVASLIGRPPIAPDLTVFDHTLLVASTWFDDAAQAEESTEHILAQLGLSHLGQRFGHELSSGQTQLFVTALVLVRPSAVLLLDEPEQRLDPVHRERLAEVLIERRDLGSTILMATHSAELASLVATDTVWLSRA